MIEYKPFIDFIEKGGELQEPSPDEVSELCEKKSCSTVHPLIEQFVKDFHKKFPDELIPYFGGIGQLSVKKLPNGTKFRIEEYDGNEQVVTMEEIEWF